MERAEVFQASLNKSHGSFSICAGTSRVAGNMDEGGKWRSGS